MHSSPETDASALTARPRRREGVLAQEAQGQTVLLRVHDGSYYAIDEVGAAIWELCDGERTLAAVVTALCQQFEAPEETVAADVLEFVADLRREQLLDGGE
jgi:pyrroloquinoline quinone biosynthesis protein D